MVVCGCHGLVCDTGLLYMGGSKVLAVEFRNDPPVLCQVGADFKLDIYQVISGQTHLIPEKLTCYLITIGDEDCWHTRKQVRPFGGDEVNSTVLVYCAQGREEVRGQSPRSLCGGKWVEGSVCTGPNCLPAHLPTYPDHLFCLLS